MKANKNCTDNEGYWPEADARVLGQILAAQNLELALPDLPHIAEFYAETLIAIPGIAACFVCLEDIAVRKGEMAYEICGPCQARQKQAPGPEPLPADSLHFRCDLAGRPGIQIIEIASRQHHFGFFVLRVGNLDVFNLYKPYLGNLGSYVAISLENRLQKNLLQKAHDELESRVRERTQDLTRINTYLQEEIQHRERIEEALKESESQIKQLVASSPVAMVVSSGVEEQVEWINDKFTELFGYTLEDMPNAEHWWPLAYPDEAIRESVKAQWHARVAEAIREKKQIEPVEATVRCKDGTLRHIEFRLSSIGSKNLITFVDFTARKRAEDALAAREMELRNLAEASPGLMGIFYLRPDGSTCMPYTSPQIEHLFGVRSEDVLEDATPLLNRIHPDDAQQVVDSIAESARTMAPWRLEYRFLHPTRGELWFEGFTNPKPHPAGGVIWYGYIREITRRKQAEMALMEREKHSQSLLRLSRFLERAENYAEVLNAARDEVKITIGYQNLWAFLFTPDKKQAKALFAEGPMSEMVLSEEGTGTITVDGDRMMEEFLASKEILVVEDAQTDARTDKKIATRMGNRTLVHVPILLFDRHLGSVGMGTFGDEGVRVPTTSEQEYLMALASHLAVTLDRIHLLDERKKAEAQLLGSEQLFRALVENSPDFIARYDREYRRIYVNPAIQKLFKTPTENIIGKIPTDQSPVFAPQAYIEQLRKVLETATESTTEMPFRTPQGEMHWGHMRFVPELGPDGKVETVLAIGRDIQEIKENEHRFRMLAENFPDFVIRLDREQRCMYVNPAVEKAFNIPAEALIGKRLPEFSSSDPPEQNLAIMAMSQRAFEEGLPNEFEASWHTQIGARVFEIRHVPEKDAAGNVVSVLRLARDITARKHAEEALRASEARFRIFVDHAADAFFLHDADSTILDVNQQASESLGYSRAELIGMTPHSFDAGLDLSLMRQMTARLDAGEIIAFETQHCRKDGHIFPVELRVRPFWIGEHRYAVSLARDITERKRSEQALHRLNRELRAISNCNQTLLRAENEQDLLTDICKIVCEEAGYYMAWVGYAEEGEGRRVRPVAWAGNEDGYLATLNITWADTERGQGPTGMAIRNGKSVCIQDFMSDPHVTLWREAALQRGYRSNIALPLQDEHTKTFGALTIYSAMPEAFTPDEIRLLEELAGDLAFGIGVLRARIERKRVEEALRESEYKLGEAARITHVGYWDRDYVAETITLSDEACQIFGLSPQYRFLNLSEWHPQWLKLIHPDDQPRVKKVLADALAGGPPYNVDYRVVRPDGEIRTIHSYAELTRDDAGNPLRLFGTMIDITERKQAEEEIHKLNQELEQRVSDRTAQLQAANKELEAFAYSVSHDLRAPLRHIGAFLELLRARTETSLDEQSQHYMDIIAASTQRMGVMIEDLLAFSRMGRSEMAKAQIDLGRLVQEVLREFEPETEGREVHWQIAPLPTIVGDRAMLRLVLENLISNALKFTRSRASAKIEVGWNAGHTAEVVIFVRDNGVGFDMDYAGKLFGVFQRLHRADEFEGTGIGLANVRRIIERHGGKVWAEAYPGAGATFSFSLPQPEN